MAQIRHNKDSQIIDRTELNSNRAATEKSVGRKEDFARNLEILTRSKRLTAAQAARDITLWWHQLAREGLKKTRQSAEDKDRLEAVLADEISPRWYRRVMREGVQRGDKRTWLWIEAMAAFFKIKYEDFWSPELTKVSIRTQEVPDDLDELVDRFRVLVQEGTIWLAEAVKVAWQARMPTTNHGKQE
jgi:hypothetical protein